MTLITDIQDTLPGVRDRRDQLEAIKAEIARRQRAAATSGLNPFSSPERRELEAMLAAGQPLEQLNQRIGARLAEEQAAEAASNALAEVRDLLKSDIDGMLNDAGAVFPRLDAALQEALEDIAALRPIRELLTPEDVLASRRIEDGERLAELLGQVTALRAEQLRVLNANSGEWPKVAILRLISNPEQLFKDLLPWLRPGYLVHRTSGEQKHIQPPPAWGWPRVQQNATSTDLTLWFIKHGGRMWIPTPTQYDDAAQTLRARAAGRSVTTREGEWVDPGPAQDSPARPLRRGERRRPAHVIG